MTNETKHKKSFIFFKQRVIPNDPFKQYSFLVLYRFKCSLTDNQLFFGVAGNIERILFI